jgi:tRNA wybutosine-synthesizing protein 4
VLIYMEPEFSDALIAWVGAQFSTALFLTYEQIRPNDPYGEVMLRNLAARHCSLRSIKTYPSKESQRVRYRKAGFKQRVQAWDMNEITNSFLDVSDFRRYVKCCVSV